MRDANFKQFNIVYVNAESKKYPIYICDKYYGLADTMQKAGLSGRKACIVSDSNVAPLYLKEVFDNLQGVCNKITTFVFPAGEENKTLPTIEAMYSTFANAKLDRKSVIIALGGGVCGDMAGFAAATYMRGIPFVQLPTSLLSQVDSSVGGKTGVDFNGQKNIIGAFYQPEFVYIQTKTLNTLPKEQFSSGMGEVIKHGLIYDEKYYEWLVENKDKINVLDFEVLVKMISGSNRIKAEIVSKDEKESGLREILNFGHTFGHAVESLCRFGLPHGHCVSIGMTAALNLSANLGYAITDEQISIAKKMFSDFGLMSQIPETNKLFSNDDIYQCMFYDKKVSNNQINLVLLEKIGLAVRFSAGNALETETAIRTAIDTIYDKELT